MYQSSFHAYTFAKKLKESTVNVQATGHYILYHNHTHVITKTKYYCILHVVANIIIYI